MTTDAPTVAKNAADPTTLAFLRRHPRDSANIVVTPRQWGRLAIYAALLFLFSAADYLLFFVFLNFAICAAYFVIILTKLFTVGYSIARPSEIRIPQSDIDAIESENLPVYTVLVPLYEEPEVAGKIIRQIEALDYPKDKLDVKLLLEEGDGQTIAACRQETIPGYCEIIVVPHSLPKTKPKACNHGLQAARGEYLVIFDAEDRPDPDQLKKAVAAFRKAPPNVACFQAKLNYYNPNQNILTRWFTIEYTTWFDLYLPGLHALGAPIPLGGTSNHFRTGLLREIGGWDPFNVTEDCDLGIRLHRMGYITQILDTTTWEEANSRLWNWIRQRSRWVKGYVQTHLVHTRRPIETAKAMTLGGFFHFLVSVGGLAFVVLLNPFYWILLSVYLGLFLSDCLRGVPPDAALSWPMLYLPLGHGFDWNALLKPDSPHWWSLLLSSADKLHWSLVSASFCLASIVLLAANAFFVFIHLLACFRRDLKKLIPYALTMPIYWVLISIAGWKGFIQLFRDPFFWEKTVHGLDKKV